MAEYGIQHCVLVAIVWTAAGRAEGDVYLVRRWGQETGISPAVRSALKKLPLKFSNGVTLFGILPGEELQELVFQPAVWRRWLHILQRNILANPLVLLTSNYVVVVQERLYVQYGWVLSYIPRDRIVEIQNRPCGLWHEMTFRLALEDQTTDYMLSLQSETVQSWRECWTRQGCNWSDASDGGRRSPPRRPDCPLTPRFRPESPDACHPGTNF